MEQLGCHWTDLHEILCLSIFRKSVEKTQVSLKSDKNNGYLREDLYIFMIPRLIFLRMRNVPGRSRENQSTHFMFSNFFSNFDIEHPRWRILNSYV
jgi:hypothetical protein